MLVPCVCLTGCRQESAAPAPPTGSGAARTEPPSASATSAVAASHEKLAPLRTNQDHAARVDDRPSFRPPDERPRHDAARLAEFGILEYRSLRLVLYTDIEQDAARTLPPLVDQVFEEWQRYFGALPPARDGSHYQLTGYVMRDQSRFRDAGLLPVALPAFAHGKHDAQQFWMNDSEFDYYRRHLMLHEATHCFMQSMGGTTRDVPVWYLEGMAELFATHAVDGAGKTSFCVLPQRKEDFVGFGRIPMVVRAVADGRWLTLDDIGRLQPQHFIQNNESYAWSWALCALCDAHPRYCSAFQTLGREYVGEGFDRAHRRLFASLIADLAAEWELFARHLCYGFDIDRAAVEFAPVPQDLLEGMPHVATISANRGWQSARYPVAADRAYHLAAAGKTVLANDPRPWDSEPQGISIRYAEGRPIGRLLGLVISDPDPQTGRRRLSDAIDIGLNTTFSVPFDGTLYLRVNDFWNELADNSGAYAVTVRAAADIP
ncbi:MAG: hypothetical protein AB7I48_01040 [Planctomycetaceae bacterium]